MGYLSNTLNLVVEATYEEDERGTLVTELSNSAEVDEDNISAVLLGENVDGLVAVIRAFAEYFDIDERKLIVMAVEDGYLDPQVLEEAPTIKEVIPRTDYDALIKMRDSLQTALSS